MRSRFRPRSAALIDPADPADPIARQFLPDIAGADRDGRKNCADPIADEAHSPVKGIVHRHPDRVLLKAVSSCPVYCRFCFRREMVGPGKANALVARRSGAARWPISQAHPEIWEVILTGGDPFISQPAPHGPDHPGAGRRPAM